MTCHNKKLHCKTQLLFAVTLLLLSYITNALMSKSSKAYGQEASANIATTAQHPFYPHISQKLALSLGVKIWRNESGGKFSGLMMWNEGEDFASIGIGHFVWRPRNKGASINDEFPRLLKYMKKRGIFVPLWLQGNNATYCPWQSHQEFLLAQNSIEIQKLRRFLLQTIPIQAEYIVYRLKTILPKLLASVPPFERPYICQQFYTLLNTPNGLYAMADYLNFKGSGTLFSKHYDNYGWGLLQVLEYMQFAPPSMVAIQSFVWSAKAILMRHVAQAPAPTRKQYEIWLSGWLKRVDSYLGK